MNFLPNFDISEVATCWDLPVWGSQRKRDLFETPFRFSCFRCETTTMFGDKEKNSTWKLSGGTTREKNSNLKNVQLKTFTTMIAENGSDLIISGFIFVICWYLSSDMGEQSTVWGAMLLMYLLWQNWDVNCICCPKKVVKCTFCEEEKTRMQKKRPNYEKGGSLCTTPIWKVKLGTERKWEGFRQKYFQEVRLFHFKYFQLVYNTKVFPRNPPFLFQSIFNHSAKPWLVRELEGGGRVADLWDLEMCHFGTDPDW